ncbi:hypothetical protein FC95_GL001512 [Lentilactobacillus kefiri DSM 20587 = JCM 5818]|uniref:Uncharacterized protein n=1 Tax=Lentilactobacillus kefiri DSM 20587 = JCM 5818 TaxID=1423764 RepID=A0A8E1RID1_LENKE|nr:hypothetical protein FD08_GL001516 [Lentilactobacillus parakefiri DSM 10551]KRM51446.1 hypothetical protein FC95_GL001512 [Lentilactobacillus kefiri DSM 20587 = JCM 5818]
MIPHFQMTNICNCFHCLDIGIAIIKLSNTGETFINIKYIFLNMFVKMLDNDVE